MTIKVKLTLKGNQQQFGQPANTIVTLPFEDYLKGVVAAEIGNSHLEACKAQAVAARTFAFSSARDGKVITDTGDSDQAFIAARRTNKATYPNAIQAVEDTRGQVLTYQGAHIGKNAHYCSANSGTTKNKSYRWKGSADLPYLVHRADPWTQAELRKLSEQGKKPVFGHGVGLSQYGARYAAGIGVKYQKILAFYYPGTQIVDSKTGIPQGGGGTMTKAETMIDYARQQVGEPYRLSARGPDEWDCSGLVMMAARSIGLDLYHGATTMYKRGFQIGDPKRYGYWSDSGPISVMPLDRMLVLFNKDKAQPGVMAHTGLYDPVTGNVIQAGGQFSGVTDRPINKGKWSDWATIKGADETVSTGSILLRQGSQGTEVTGLQLALKELGYPLGSFGPNKDGVDGKFGAQTAKAVRAYQEANGLVIDGFWKTADQDKLDEVMNVPGGPAEGPGPDVAEALALLADAQENLLRAIVLLREV